MTFANIYNEIQNDPSLVPKNAEEDDLQIDVDNLDTEEAAPPSDYQGISPVQQGEALIGTPPAKKV